MTGFGTRSEGNAFAYEALTRLADGDYRVANPAWHRRHETPEPARGAPMPTTRTFSLGPDMLGGGMT